MESWRPAGKSWWDGSVVRCRSGGVKWRRMEFRKRIFGFGWRTEGCYDANGV